jgi:4-amino-4-deoxy-L-arabinose transferase-like glycosyltransferase
MVAALAAAHVAIRGPRLRWGWWLLSAVACGFGLLTKGPVALALLAGPVLGYQILDPRAAPLRSRAWLAYLVLAIAVAGPWYLAVAAVEPGFAEYFFWKHNIIRYMAPFDHQEPAWFYLPGLFLGMLPWTLLVVPFLGSFKGKAAWTMRRPPEQGFFLLAALWGLVFFSLAGCKRATYILPVMPPLALALGCQLDSMIARVDGLGDVALLLRQRFRLAYLATAVVLIVGLVASLMAVWEDLLRPTVGFAVALGALFALIWLGRHGMVRDPAVSWALCAAATFALLLVGVHEILPRYAHRFALCAQVQGQAHLAGDSHVPVACYPRRWDSVSYYLGRDDVEVYLPSQWQRLIADLQTRPCTLLFIKSEATLMELQRCLPPTMQFRLQSTNGTLLAGVVCQSEDE